MPRTKRVAKAVDVIWTIPDSLWPTLEAILLEFYPVAKTGRPRGDLRTVFNGILYRMRSGVPVGLPAPRVRVGHDGARLVPAIRPGWRVRAALGGVDRSVRRVAGGEVGMAGGRWGNERGEVWGEFTGKNPTDRAKPGTKRMLLVDEDGGPLGAIIAPANAHDSTLIGGVIEAVVVDRPNPKASPRTCASTKGSTPRTPRRNREGEVRPAHPFNRRREQAVRPGEGTQAAAVGGRADDRLAQQVPGHPRATTTRRPRTTSASPNSPVRYCGGDDYVRSAECLFPDSF